MHADVDDSAVASAVEESRHTPRLLVSGCTISRPAVSTRASASWTLSIKIDKSGFHRCCGVLGQATELMTLFVAEGDDPTVIHQDPESKHSGVLPDCGGEIGHGQIRDYSLDPHMPIVAATIVAGRE